MAVNRYDLAAPYEYVSQYVPIPFLELLTLGQYYAGERKAAEQLLHNYIKDANEFQSLIEKDVDNYYKISFNDLILSKINEAASDPSVMKSAAWRAGLTGALNSVDYASLSKLKQSAQQAELYDKLYKQLAAEGKMYPGWEEDYFRTYDTLASGLIFDKTPLPYSSVEDVAWDFVKDLKDTHLRSAGGYNWYGVDANTALQQVAERESELLANPYVRRHYKVLTSAGLTEQEALQEIRNRANTAALRAVREKPIVDPYAMAATQAEYALRLQTEKNSGKGDNNSAYGVLGPEDMLVEDAKRKNADIVARAESDPEYIQKYLPQRTQIGQALSDAIESYKNDPTFAELYDKYTDYLVNRGYMLNDAIIAATQIALSGTTGISEQNKALFTSLLQQDSALKQKMTEEAIGRSYIESFNISLGNADRNTNPFKQMKSKIENAWFGSTEYFDENMYQHMWGNAIIDSMVEISPDVERLFNQELYGAELPKKEEGFKESPRNLVSPKQFISGTNFYVQQMIDEAGINDISSVKLNRSATRAGDTAKFDLEERAVKGEFGELRTERVLGYIDTPDARNYVVRVRVPIGEGSAFNDKMTAWAAIDDVSGAVSETGYSPMIDENGNPFINLTLIKSVKNKGIDKTRRNRRYLKDLGTNDSKNAQITQDDISLQGQGYDYNISGGFDYDE